MSWRLAVPIVLAMTVASIAIPAVESLPSVINSVPEARTIRTSHVLSYPVTDLAGNVVGSQAWRVVNNTGNCCENLVMTTPDGRIMDVGGDQILITSTDGVSWGEASPLLQSSGEGSMAYAPNGDIVAIIWDPYTGDRLTAMKLRAGATRWDTAQVALHRPFYDRPWVSIAPGPIEMGDETYPYAAILHTNFNLGAPTENTLVSVDGLTYLPSLRNRVGFGAVDTFTQPAVAWADWVQPIGHGRVTPLPGGGALSSTGCPWERLGQDLLWECVIPRGPVGARPAIARFDSLGRYHVLNTDTQADVLHYRMSLDGGATWRTTTIPRFGDIVATDYADFVVNGALDRALINLRYVAGGTDHFVVLRLTELSAAAPKIEVLQAGLGDRALGDASGDNDRFDFVTIAMLPDGRAVTSFADSAHHPPVMAIELP